jgi:superfamily II DNA/RNA helicase
LNLTTDALSCRRVERQTILVSATMPPAVLRAAAIWGHRPLLVRAQSIIQVEDYRLESSAIDPVTKELSSASPDLQGARESLPPNLDHLYVVAPLRHHVDILRKSIHALEARSVIVFLNHSRRLKDVEFKLEARGLVAGTYIHHFILFYFILFKLFLCCIITQWLM